MAAQEGNADVVKCLVREFGADTNQANIDGATPAFLAAQMGHVATLRLLVRDLGADVRLALLNGCTPLSSSQLITAIRLLCNVWSRSSVLT
jgi:ankyrin repeat protein